MPSNKKSVAANFATTENGEKQYSFFE